VLALREPDTPAPQEPREAVATRRRLLVAGPAIAVVSLIAAVLATESAGLSIRDPDHVAGRRLLLVLGLVVVLIALDVVLRARRGSDRLLPTWAALDRVRRERWTLRRGLAVGSALISFYLTYLAYRNLKSVVPLLRPGDLFDAQLADIDRTLFLGNDPAELLHSLLGTGVPTQLMSASYMLFFIFIPGTLAAALVFSQNLQAGLFYATAQSLNWLLGAASYFMLPSLGPVYAEPSIFSGLPVSGVTQLQAILLDQRVEFLRDPALGTAQSIAAFASLHVSIFFTGALAAHVLGLAKPVRVAAWLLLGLTTLATIYLGWHYVLDDFGGLVIGALAIVMARGITGFDLRAARRASTPIPAAA
jgi:hypothetical protein